MKLIVLVLEYLIPLLLITMLFGIFNLVSLVLKKAPEQQNIFSDNKTRIFISWLPFSFLISFIPLYVVDPPVILPKGMGFYFLILCTALIAFSITFAGVFSEQIMQRNSSRYKLLDQEQSADLEKYVHLIADYLSRTLPTEKFVKDYFSLFRRETNKFPPELEALFHKVFESVEIYAPFVSDDELEYGNMYIDKKTLYKEVNSAYKKIINLLSKKN